MITKDRKNISLARIYHPKIELVVEKGMMGDETTKNAGDGMMVHRRGGGATITINHEGERDLVSILRIEEDQMVNL